MNCLTWFMQNKPTDILSSVTGWQDINYDRNINNNTEIIKNKPEQGVSLFR